MHPRWILMLGALAAIAVFGCHTSFDRRSDGVEVVVESGGAMPEAIAGRWVSERHGWEFEFEPDGRIVSAVISLGRVRVIPGRTTTVPTRSGDKGVFTPGHWTVHYAPDTRQLTLRIVMDRVRVQIGSDVMEGSSTDVLAGPLDLAAGTWQAQWTTFTRYTAYSPDKPPADLSTDADDGETTPLAFHRTTTP